MATAALLVDPAARVLLELLDLDGAIAVLVRLARQTVEEGERFGIEARYLRDDDGQPGTIITNYEMLPHFDPEAFDGIVLDESSILKAHDGKTRTAILESFAKTRFKLAFAQISVLRLCRIDASFIIGLIGWG